MQARTDLYEIYLDLAEEFRLPVRMLSRDQAKEQDPQARERARARGLLFNEHMIYPWPRRTRAVFFEEIPKLPAGVSEILLTLALDGDELRAYDPLNAGLRSHDAECLTDPAVSRLLDLHCVKRISFRDLRELQRAS